MPEADVSSPVTGSRGMTVEAAATTPASSPESAPPTRRAVRSWEKAALGGLVFAVVLVLGLTSFSRTERPDSVDARARVADVQKLLDSWAAAVRVGDTRTLAGLFDSAATPEFVEAEMRRATNAAGVSFTDWGYEFTGKADAAVPPEVVDGLGAHEVWAPSVHLRYAVNGADEVSTRKPVSLVVVRRGGEWKLLSDNVPHSPDRVTWRGPWDFGPVLTREVTTDEGRISVVMGHPEQAAMLDALADELTPAIRSVTELWGSDWPRRALVMVASSQDEFTALVGSEHDGAAIAAVAVSDAVDKGHEVSGQRVIFSPASVNRLTDETRRSVLRHELMHVAARSHTEDRSPMWILEGFAEYSGHRGSGLGAHQIAPTLAASAADRAHPQVPENADFSAVGERASIAYETAWSLNAFVADEFGEASLTQLYRALSVGPSDATVVDEQLREVLGVDFAEFRDQWGRWLSAEFT